MTLGGIEPIFISFVTFFIILALLHQNEEGWLGRSILVSLLLSLVILLLPFGFIGYGIALLVSFIILIKVQKYSLLSSLLFLIVADLVSYFIQLGIHKYF